MKIKIDMINGWLILLVAFLIPFNPRFISVPVVLVLLLTLLTGNIRERFKKILQNRIALLSVALYLFYVLGLLWSTNLDYGLFDLQIKLTLLLFPLIFLSGALPGNSGVSNIMEAFTKGCLVALIICLLRAGYYFFANDKIMFFYQKFSWFVHPSYFSMYLNLAVAYLLLSRFLLPGGGRKRMNNYSLIVISLLMISLLLLSSKAGIITLLMVLLVSFVHAIRLRLGKNVALMISLSFVVMLIFTFLSPMTSRRMAELRDTLEGSETGENVRTSGMRLQAWNGAISLIRESPLLGYGTGDIKDELLRVYEEKGFEAIRKIRLNAHNQFLQTAGAIGLTGVGIFITLLATAFISGIRKRNMLMIFFIIIFTSNVLVESMLEVSAGVIFFAFFLCVISVLPEQRAGRTV